jgi:hypothetical protein
LLNNTLAGPRGLQLGIVLILVPGWGWRRRVVPSTIDFQVSNSHRSDRNRRQTKRSQSETDKKITNLVWDFEQISKSANGVTTGRLDRARQTGS